jgi:two-component system chemotaxis response regulator CheB
MPRAALDLVHTEHVLPAAKIGALLSDLALSEVPDGPADDDPTLAAEVAMSDMAPLTTDEFFNDPAGFGCPACGGALYELPSAKLPRYRCRVGHAWAPESLLDEQAAGLEGALWTALRVLEERAALADRLANGSAGGPTHEMRYRKAADDAIGTASTIRSLIEGIGVAGDGRSTGPDGRRR